MLGIVQINLPSALGLASVQLAAPRQTCLRGALLFIGAVGFNGSAPAVLDRI